MELSLKKSELAEYIVAQLNTFFPDVHKIDKIDITKVLDRTLDRLEFNFKHTSKFAFPYYWNEKNEIFFNHLNSEQYAMFLWLLSNEAYINNLIHLAEKCFYLNKLLNGLDVFYSRKLPNVFMFVHPLGTVIGNAEFDDYLIIYQNVTIGGTPDNKWYPCLSKNTILFANVSVIGNNCLGENVTLSAGNFVVNTDIPNHTIVFGQGKNLVLKQEKHL